MFIYCFSLILNFAERRGFEPRIPFRSIHAFQACLFNHSSISPLSGRKSRGSFRIYQIFGQIKYKSSYCPLTSLPYSPETNEHLPRLQQYSIITNGKVIRPIENIKRQAGTQTTTTFANFHRMGDAFFASC